MLTIWQAIAHTPIWVYLLLFFLIFLGFKASKTHVVSFKELLLTPLLLTFMSIHTLLTAVKPNMLTVSTWAIAILFGTLLGWLQASLQHLEVDKKNYRIKIPGSWITMILILIIFVTKYFFGYEMAIDPTLAELTGFELSMLIVSGVCTGLFIGRFICYLHRLRTKKTREHV